MLTLDKKSNQENIQFRIDDFGMCTKYRVLTMKDYLSFGISEIISTGMQKVKHKGYSQYILFTIYYGDV